MAVSLAVLAGFVDAVGYLSLGGVFVAFMSGNSTVMSVGAMSVGAAAGPAGRVALAGSLVAAFVGGVVAGTLAGRAFGRQRAAGILALVAALLGGGAWLGQVGWTGSCGVVLAMAMGAENTAFQRPGRAALGLTYMTGALVRFGQRLANALTGGPWRPVLPDLLLWLGMVGGALLGAGMWRAVGLDGLWLAVFAAVVMAGVAWGLGRRAEGGREGRRG